jgi:hypothetical protein
MQLSNEVLQLFKTFETRNLTFARFSVLYIEVRHHKYDCLAQVISSLRCRARGLPETARSRTEYLCAIKTIPLPPPTSAIVCGALELARYPVLLTTPFHSCYYQGTTW